MSYAGDVSCKDCYSELQKTPGAQLVDVRTLPEWMFVGTPDLGALNKRVITVDWQRFPDMQINSAFSEAVSQAVVEAGGSKSDSIFCLCRSGVRSIAAAQALTAAGFENAYNVLGGFEGDMNEDGHRGQLAGWKFDGLPWVQR